MSDITDNLAIDLGNNDRIDNDLANVFVWASAPNLADLCGVSPGTITPWQNEGRIWKMTFPDISEENKNNPGTRTTYYGTTLAAILSYRNSERTGIQTFLPANLTPSDDEAIHLVESFEGIIDLANLSIVGGGISIQYESPDGRQSNLIEVENTDNFETSRKSRDDVSYSYQSQSERVETVQEMIPTSVYLDAVVSESETDSSSDQSIGDIVDRVFDVQSRLNEVTEEVQNRLPDVNMTDDASDLIDQISEVESQLDDLEDRVT